MEKIILRITLFFVVTICFTTTSCLQENDLKLPFKTFAPVDLHDGWEIATPAQEGIDAAELTAVYKEFHERGDLWQVRSLLVFRNNKLIAESYTKNPQEITQPVAIWSCTKQVVAILAGIAVEQGLIGSVSENLQTLLPEVIGRFPEKGEITLQNLLQMQSGIAFSNEGFGGESNQLLMQKPANSLDFILNLPKRSAAGEEFHYNDGDPHLVSAILQRHTGKSTKTWAEELLFSKLGMKNYDWVVYRDGITPGAFGIMATPREMARIGQLLLNKGLWKGEQIVSSEWIEEMTSVKITAEKANFHEKSFGYYWWIDEARGIVFMAGHGGQHVFVKPSKNLIIVSTADKTEDERFGFNLQKAFEIVDAIDSIVRN
ncbi:MAG: beta-lactamase family protein [Bacteroidales bacterium]|jgi:CubicO group peptidase (beta-lactamase class C family)|nr:beta-lactamase family protein [Bacteroidales bacterium]